MVLPAVSKVGRSEKTPAGPKHSLPDMGVEGRAGVNIGLLVGQSRYGVRSFPPS
jgi:hypothetical protein